MTKFRFDDEVKVISGFYEGRAGNVVMINEVDHDSWQTWKGDSYCVEITDKWGQIHQCWIREKELELKD